MLLKKYLVKALFAALLVTLTPLSAPGANPDVVFKAMEKEMKRNMKGLHMEDYKRPYFMAYRLTEVDVLSLEARYGALVQNYRNTYRVIYTEVRVGDYKFDNTGDNAYRLGARIGENIDYYAPVEDDPKALMHKLWLMSDIRYKEAINQYMKKKGQNIFRPREDLIDFTHEKKVVYMGSPVSLNLDSQRAVELVKKVSAVFKEYPEIINSSVSFDARAVNKYFINSEGTRILQGSTSYYIRIDARTKAEDGMPVQNFHTFFFTSPEDIPPEDEIIQAAHDVAEQLIKLKKAKEMEPYSGPAILTAEVAGVFFHEVLGHRLEGERQRSEMEGKTFSKKLGEKIAPGFIDIIDDPTLESFQGTKLAGHYLYDDEGVPAQKVALVKNGVLKNYLTSRTPPKGYKHSNGHGRAADIQKPMARMGNLIVKSHKEMPYEELKKKLLELLREKNKPFGFILKKARGGETNTSRFGFQAFKGKPVLVYKVYAKDGREELVRGVEIVGTPLITINKIVATGNDYGVFNGYCGAESGYIPVSTVAPSILVSEIELQKTAARKKRPPILKPPL